MLIPIQSRKCVLEPFIHLISTQIAILIFKRIKHHLKAKRRAIDYSNSVASNQTRCLKGNPGEVQVRLTEVRGGKVVVTTGVVLGQGWEDEGSDE